MSAQPVLHLFDGFGIELEYMLVDAKTLAVLPVSDQILHTVAGTYASEVDLGEVAWSNELVLHVIELKTNGPARELTGLPNAFMAHIAHINSLLAPLGGCLMPSAMHPWMEPRYETRLWPHEYNPVYVALDRIFGCQGHGWANLQSVHLNLPFANDAEFGPLHAAIRLLLPIMPALAASSPIIERRPTGFLDTRMEVYRTNAARVPSVSGDIIPEPVFTKQAYEQQILQRLYQDIATYDPEGILQYEWLNARGAIARFDRNTIEIRVLDVQECPLADMAICAAIVEVLKLIMAEHWCRLPEQQAWPTSALHAILRETMQTAEHTLIADAAYLRSFGLHQPHCTAGELWQHVLEATTVLEAQAPWALPLRTMIQHGPLARRIMRALQEDFSPARLDAVYRRLCTCLSTNTLFTGTL
jgi:gamma-glutamyl:cysteine ligase YbdK (ATP-grasp superfamily)